MSATGNSNEIVLGKLDDRQKDQIEQIESNRTKMYLDFGMVSLHFLDPATDEKSAIELFIGADNGKYAMKIMNANTDKLLLEIIDPPDEVVALFRDSTRIIGELLSKTRRN